MGKNVKRTSNTHVYRTDDEKRKFAKSIINYLRGHRATWEMAKVHFGYSVSSLQGYVREYGYTRRGDYDNLLADVQKYTQLRKKLDGIVDAPAKDVIVTETGYLMKVGLEEVLDTGMDIIIPKFCESELENLSSHFTSAETVLAKLRESCAEGGPITMVKLSTNTLFEAPASLVKRRTEGIVAVCCDVYAESPGDRKIHLLTSSYEVSELAKAQGFGSNLSIQLLKKS